MYEPYLAAINAPCVDAKSDNRMAAALGLSRMVSSSGGATAAAAAAARVRDRPRGVTASSLDPAADAVRPLERRDITSGWLPMTSSCASCKSLFAAEFVASPAWERSRDLVETILLADVRCYVQAGSGPTRFC